MLTLSISYGTAIQEQDLAGQGILKALQILKLTLEIKHWKGKDECFFIKSSSIFWRYPKNELSELTCILAGNTMRKFEDNLIKTKHERQAK